MKLKEGNLQLVLKTYQQCGKLEVDKKIRRDFVEQFEDFLQFAKDNNVKITALVKII